jgi:aspartyl-tRNA synthetase
MQAERIRNEYVLRVIGKVRQRPEGTINADLATGQVEVLVTRLEVLNKSETPPFQIEDEDVSEEHRLRYRYIDLRRPEMLRRLRLRSEITRILR